MQEFFNAQTPHTNAPSMTALESPLVCVSLALWPGLLPLATLLVPSWWRRGKLLLAMLMGAIMNDSYDTKYDMVITEVARRIMATLR